MKHSSFFTEYQNNPPDALLRRIRAQDVHGLSHFYSQMTDLLRESRDAEFGVISGLVEVDVDGKKELQWIRDATSPIPLKHRIAHDLPTIEANNTLLRCLGRLRAVDFALSKKYGPSHFADALRMQLKADLEQYTQAVLTRTQSKKSKAQQLDQIDKLETAWNTKLIKALHQANLTKGCTSKKDAEDLLSHYRNLSSLVQPARTLVTLSYDKKAKVLLRETQYPVTQKTETQKSKLQQLKMLQPYPHKKERNAHNIRKLAHQEADSLFADLLLDDATLLPSQGRSTHDLGTKNSFIVKTELIPCSERPEDPERMTLESTAENILWLARTAAPVYIGQGAHKASVQEETRENLQQIRRAAEYRMKRRKLNVHVTSLTTHMPIDREQKIVAHLFDATRHRRHRGYEDNISYAPANIIGTFHRLNLAQNLRFAEGQRPANTLPLQQLARLKQISKIILAAAQDKSLINILQCASGQDRVGTAIEYSITIWMKQRYKALGLDSSLIEATRAEAGNVAEMATHLVPGSPGLKLVSQPANWISGERAFSKLATAQFYLKSANTNRLNKVRSVSFLKRPSEAALREFEESVQVFSRNLRTVEKKLQHQGLELLQQIKKSIIKAKGKAKNVADCNTVLVHANVLLTSTDPSQLKESGRRLASLSKAFSVREGFFWRSLAAMLLGFVSIALLLVGILGVLPTAGASISFLVFGALGLTGSLGLLVPPPRRAPALVKSISFFKAQAEINQEDKAQMQEHPSSKFH